MYFIYARHTAGPRRGKWVVFSVYDTLSEARAAMAGLDAKGTRAQIRDAYSGAVQANIREA